MMCTYIAEYMLLIFALHMYLSISLPTMQSKAIAQCVIYQVKALKRFHKSVFAAFSELQEHGGCQTFGRPQDMASELFVGHKPGYKKVQGGTHIHRSHIYSLLSVDAGTPYPPSRPCQWLLNHFFK